LQKTAIDFFFKFGQAMFLLQAVMGVVFIGKLVKNNNL